ncbi:GIY-YIG nuclease family protein [Terricaulis sp.]|uniref:GIY-YIG nuclease family protein n=1 Tax=Terricaulis sp. TaxID=2768686 RepID=UPI003782FB25
MARYDLIAVYIMANKRNGTIYLGVTSDLLQRGLDHREGRFDGFAKKYGCKTLVWWEQHHEMNEAIAREKQLKAWERKWKLDLIEKANPTWRDLYEDFLLPPSRRPEE